MPNFKTDRTKLITSVIALVTIVFSGATLEYRQNHDLWNQLPPPLFSIDTLLHVCIFFGVAAIIGLIMIQMAPNG